MKILFDDIINDIAPVEFKRISINNSIDIWFNNLEYNYDSICLLLDEEVVARLEFYDIEYSIKYDTVYIYLQ
ncbi:MAG: hypothetical protein J6D47_13265 [Peptostreptococcaceae bacterium]|nr:hypothetical protein [Peptostreptococcaceae bacterium]MBP3930520.1 hypothetical protein [Peptostreptococcaceae bacterium]